MFNRQDVVQSLYMREVSASERKKIILAVKNKSCHKTVSSARFLKIIVDINAGPILIILNKSIQTSHFPNSVKLARVEQIYKSGSTTDINNYGPVSILPLLSITFERVICNRLHIFLRNIKY